MRLCVSQALRAILLLLSVCTFTFAQSGPPSNYTVGCLATISIYGGVKFDFNNPAPLSAFNCPSTGCDPDARVSAFMYQLDQINQAKQLLPNTKLIPACVDDQGDSSRAFFAAIDLLNAGVHSVFGTYYSRVALNADLVLKGENVPLIAWASSSPELGNKKLYSNFGRVCQSDAGQAEAMSFLAAKQFGWQSVAVIYTADAYGQGGANAFVENYLAYNLSIVSDQSIIAGASVGDVELALQRIKSIGVQTIVYFGHPEEFESIIARGSKPDLDMFNNHTAWIVSDADLLGGGTQWKQAAAAGLLNGFVGFSSDDGRSEKIWQDWATAYMKRNVTGGNPLITVKPKSFDEISAYDVFAADAANVAATALKSLFDAGNYAPSPTDWLNAIHAVNIQGITGPIAFDQNFERIGIKYTLKNLKSGVWTPIATYANRVITFNGALSFADGTSIPPPSFPLPAPPAPPATSVIAASTSKVLLAVTIVVLTITGIFAACLVMGREVKVFQNASVTMLGLLILGGAMVCVSVLVALQTQSRSSCTVSQWLFNIGFMLTIGSILLKTYRVHVIFNSYKLKVTVMTDNRLLMVMGAMLLFDVVILVLRTTIAPYELNDRLVCTFADGYQSDAALALSLILVITKALMLLYTAYLTYRVRNLPSRFNESSYLSVCVYNAALLCLIWIVIRYAINTDDHPDTINVFECALKLVGTTLILTLIFLPKCITALVPILGRKLPRGSRNSAGNSKGSKSGVSILAMSGEGTGQPKKIQTKEGETETRRTKADIETIIDGTIVSQTELLERSYVQLDSLHAAVAEKKALIQNTIDLLNQLEDESKFFRDCVHKQYTEHQIVTIFESRLKDITIPHADGLMSGGMTALQSNIGKASSVLSMSQPRSSILPRSNNSGGQRVASPGNVPRGTLGPKPLPKTNFPNRQTPIKDTATTTEAGPSNSVTMDDPVTPTKTHSNSRMPRPGHGRLGRDSKSNNSGAPEGISGHITPANIASDVQVNQIDLVLPSGLSPIERSPSSSEAAAPSSSAVGPSSSTSPRRNRIRIHMMETGSDSSTFSAAFHQSSPSDVIAAPSGVASTPAGAGHEDGSPV